MLALFGAAHGPVVEFLRLAGDHQADQRHQQQHDQPAPLTQEYVQRVGQQRAQRAAAVAELIAPADEIGEGGDGHVLFDDGAGAEQLHHGEAAEKQYEIHDHVDDPHLFAAGGEDQQNADPDQHQRQQGIDAAAHAAHHIAHAAHGRAGLGLRYGKVHHQHRQAEAHQRAQHLQKRRGCGRLFFVYALSILFGQYFLHRRPRRVLRRGRII